jgi:corrinoid protein of di/trimethylamine methyltransferase
MAYERLFEQMTETIIAGIPERARQLASQAIETGVDPLEAIERGFKPGMDFVGESFSRGELFIPDLMMAGEAMKTAISTLEPELISRQQERKVLGKVVMGTVQGDIHEIGKTLVSTMLSANGFEVYDLGVDVAAGKFVDAVRDTQADVIGLSALLTTTVLNQETVIQALVEAGLRDRVKVIIGGVPANQEWADEIGADAYAENATEAVTVIKELVAAS